MSIVGAVMTIRWKNVSVVGDHKMRKREMLARQSQPQPRMVECVAGTVMRSSTAFTAASAKCFLRRCRGTTAMISFILLTIWSMYSVKTVTSRTAGDIYSNE